MFSLIEIKDTHSGYKSEIAQRLVKDVLNKKYKIKYIDIGHPEDSEERVKCENNITEKYSTSSCGVKICDIFILENNETGELLQIGNTCIQNLILEDFITNINKDDFINIIKLLKIENICFLCHKNKKAGYHKSCLKGTGSNIKVDTNQIKTHATLIKHIKVNHILNIIQKFFKNNTFLKNLKKNQDFNKKTMNALDRFIDDYSIIIDNIDKLQRFKNNCIVKSVSIATRNPSDKQMIILEKILYNYEQMIKYDNLNKHPKYIKYGFVYQY